MTAVTLPRETAFVDAWRELISNPDAPAECLTLVAEQLGKNRALAPVVMLDVLSGGALPTPESPRPLLAVLDAVYRVTGAQQVPTERAHRAADVLTQVARYSPADGALPLALCAVFLWWCGDLGLAKIFAASARQVDESYAFAADVQTLVSTRLPVWLLRSALDAVEPVGAHS